jgi:predicted nucleic acid-binding Zn ribbon protein
MIYQYKCNRCNNIDERELFLKDILNAAKPPKFLCSKCGGTTRKLINLPSVQYKGEGFTKKVQDK